MTIKNITDREIALTRELNIANQLANLNAAIAVELKGKRDKLQEWVATLEEIAKQLSDKVVWQAGEIAKHLATIEVSRKQEAVAFLVMRYEGGHENLETTSDGATNSFPVYAAPVIASDVLKDAERYRILRDPIYQLHEDDISVSDMNFQTYFLDDLDKEVDKLAERYAAMGGAND